MAKLEEAQVAQTQVETYHDKMYERGYFRDSYTSSNLLWLFNLDWWSDIAELLNDDGQMSPANTTRFLQMLTDNEGGFEASLLEQEAWEGWVED